MQWLINAIKEWVLEQGYLTAGYVDRGDPATQDYAAGDLTKDGAWHDLDLSAIVPAGAKAVLFSARLRNTGTTKWLQLRKNGNANSWNVAIALTQVAVLYYDADLVVPVDTDRKINYATSSTGWIDIRLTVKGWWF